MASQLYVSAFQLKQTQACVPTSGSVAMEFRGLELVDSDLAVLRQEYVMAANRVVELKFLMRAAISHERTALARLDKYLEFKEVVKVKEWMQAKGYAQTGAAVEERGVDGYMMFKPNRNAQESFGHMDSGECTKLTKRIGEITEFVPFLSSLTQMQEEKKVRKTKVIAKRSMNDAFDSRVCPQG